MSEFISFPKIEHYDRQPLIVTQKLNGSNASVKIFRSKDGELTLVCGSRTRWIYPGEDNYGFAAFVHANKTAFLELLGEGHHYGEWCGPGINSGEGLSEKTFYLFDFWKYGDQLPPQTKIIPLLYQGRLDLSKVTEAMDDLKVNGSKAQPGFMRPEGVVVTIGKTRYKKIFENESTRWKSGDGKKERLRELSETVDVDHLLQPIRLEKLLSKDERYLSDYPKSLADICRDYVGDLIEENEIKGDEGEIAVIRKALGSSLFEFVKYQIKELNEVKDEK